MKYIDAEKLYKKVEELMAKFAELETEAETDDMSLTFYQGKRKMCSEILTLITSLQQGQPVRKEQISHLEHWLAFFGCPEENIEKCATQIAQGYGAIRYLEGVQHGAEAVNELAQQEQPEELEKKIDDWYNTMGIPITADALKETARHFFELGLKAQKGE